MMRPNMGVRQRRSRTRAGTGAGIGAGTRVGVGAGTRARARGRFESSESFRALSSALLFSFLVVLPVGIRVDSRVSTNGRSRRPMMMAVARPRKSMMRATGAVRSGRLRTGCSSVSVAVRSAPARMGMVMLRGGGMRRRRSRVTTRFVHRKLRALRVLGVLGVLIFPLRVGAYVAVIALGRTVGVTILPRMREMDGACLGRMMGRAIGSEGRREVVANEVMVLRRFDVRRVCGVMRRRRHRLVVAVSTLEDMRMFVGVMARRRGIVPLSAPEACPGCLLRALTSLLFAPLPCEGVERGWTIDSSVSERFQPILLTLALTLFFALLVSTLPASLSGTLRLRLASRLLGLLLLDLGFVASSLFAVQRSEAFLAVLPRSTFLRASRGFLLRLGFPARLLFVLGGDGASDLRIRSLATSGFRCGHFLFPAAALVLNCAVMSGVLLQALTFGLVKLSAVRDAFRLRKASNCLLVLMQSFSR
jgi:hypothetical protein